METKDVNKVNIKAEYLTKSFRVNFRKILWFQASLAFFLSIH